jgi:hypothetical protein
MSIPSTFFVVGKPSFHESDSSEATFSDTRPTVSPSYYESIPKLITMLGRIGMGDERKLIISLRPCKGASIPIIKIKGLNFIEGIKRLLYV